MKKPVKSGARPERTAEEITEGGFYVRDPDTGVITRTHFTAQTEPDGESAATVEKDI